MLSVRLKTCQFQTLGLVLTHWGWVTHICVSKLTIIGSYNGLSPGQRQAIIWTNAGTLLIRPLGTNFNEILIEILTFLFIKIRLKVSSAKWCPFCLSLNVLMVTAVTVKFFHYQQVHIMKSVMLHTLCVHVLFQGCFFSHSSNSAYFSVNKGTFSIN